MRRRRSIGKRQGDYLVIRVLQAVLSAALITAGIGLATIVFWFMALGAESGDELPRPLLVLVVMSLIVTGGCHWLIRWVRPALR